LKTVWFNILHKLFRYDNGEIVNPTALGGLFIAIIIVPISTAMFVAVGMLLVKLLILWAQFLGIGL